MAKTSERLFTLNDLLSRQLDFQRRLNNKLPQSIVDFGNVQTSLSHNIYQTIEFQEFIEADSIKDRQEELIDYLLFMLNKYLYLMPVQGVRIPTEVYLSGLLWSFNSDESLAQCNSLANLEQNAYITLIRKHCIFKPWKNRDGENCAPFNAVYATFIQALDYFKQMANIVFSSYEELHECLEMKLKKNVDRQNSGY